MAGAAVKGIRFEAEWIERQYLDDPDGEWNPDKDEYACSYHLTREAAEAAAIAASKKVAIEWFRIAEQEYNGHEWVDRRRWIGDWDGIVEQVFVAEDCEA